MTHVGGKIESSASVKMKQSPEARPTENAEKQMEREKPVARWRRIARGVGKQKKWTKECIIKVLADTDGDPLEGTNLQRIPFNANFFKAHVQFGRLSARAKHLCTKDPDVRTDEDIKDLYRVVHKLQCFNKYSRPVKKGLAKFVYYSQFQARRVIVQQGHPALSFYFILSGSVKVLVEDKDRITGNITKNVVGEILAGESFGELALLHNTKRRASIICKEDAEFLRLDKEDFNQVLRDTYQKEWDERMTHLKAMTAFQDWPLKELCAANTASKLVEYQDNALLLKDEVEPSEFVYLIKSGQCLLIRNMKIIKRSLPYGREKLILPPENNEISAPRLNRLKKNETLLKLNLVVRTLRQGDYFGVGENMKDSFIITKGKVELMLMPRSVLDRYNRGKVLKMMREELPDKHWTRKDIFNVFLQSRNWDHFKKQLVEDILVQKPTRKTYIVKQYPRLY